MLFLNGNLAAAYLVSITVYKQVISLYKPLIPSFQYLNLRRKPELTRTSTVCLKPHIILLKLTGTTRDGKNLGENNSIYCSPAVRLTWTIDIFYKAQANLFYTWALSSGPANNSTLNIKIGHILQK